MSVPGGHDCDHMSGDRVEVPGVASMEDGHGKGLNGGFASGDQSVKGSGDGKNLLSFGIVGHAQVVDEVDSQDITVKMFADHKGSGGIPTFVGSRESVDPVEFNVVISGADYVGLVIEMFGF